MMEEEGGVKAPARRLRRRTSAELSDDTKSPLAPATPTQKRGGRLAAKPQLELINEDVIQNSPKRASRKSIAKDITETEEKPVTPARRSARVKSNTSIVSEVDEKVLTPARRNTRIKSNTSIISETTTVAESPRAKRAALRRISKGGSDTEVALTPTRTMRTRKTSTSGIDKEETPSVSATTVTPGRVTRTRKGSTSSLDSPVKQTNESTALIKEVISEEPEDKSPKSVASSGPKNVETTDDSPTLRKSPRFERKSRKSSSRNTDTYEDLTQEANKNTHDNDKQKVNTPDVRQETEQDFLSISSANLIKNLEPIPHKKTSAKNKSTSDIECSDSNSKRHRTKSWTTSCGIPPDEGIFFSDNESTKKKLKKQGKLFSEKRHLGAGSGDGPTEQEGENAEIAFNTSKNSRKSYQKSFVIESVSPKKAGSVIEKPKDADISNESNKENILGVAPVRKESSAGELLFENPPNGEIKSMVFLEDSDSNTDSENKKAESNSVEVVDTGDQCVPVVLHSISDQVTPVEQSVFTRGSENQVASNVSCEPMDIDETMPENVSLTEYSGEDKLNSSEEKQSRKSSLSSVHEESPFKPKRKSAISNSLGMAEQTASGKGVALKFSHCELSQSKQSRKSSLCLSQEESPYKPKRKSSHSTSEVFGQTENKNECEASPSSTSKSQNKQSRKSSLSIQDGDSFSKESSYVSKRKSSFQQDLEKSANENKSTLILSQIKDISDAENNFTKSPRNNIELSNLVKDGPVNKNLTLNYLTSTPVQQKSNEKLSMQMNTSVITPTNDSKNTFKQTNNNSKKDVSVVSKHSEKESKSSDEHSRRSEDNFSREKRLFVDEAEVADDDYESGDSQDDDERQYEIDNEIEEKGETLTSDEEISNDSNYEKDSFIVSSDEEDNQLLSGSGDDLGMSDNELTMSAKSKKKFDERKTKQQKKSSREMFEARHRLNESNKINKSESKSKKNNRLRLDSSLLEEVNDNMVPPKKNKRMRLESTLENLQSELEEATSKNDSIVEEEKISVDKKKNTKRLSESMCNKSTVNEKEITFYNENELEDDPLLIKVKPEPKTPQKDFEISTIQFTHREDIEEVGVDENVSMMKQNETTDPLQATITQDNADTTSDEGSISENEEITNNFDSILKKLNEGNKKQVKSHDLSLNLEKKTKKAKQAIIEELNLTQAKKMKKSKDSSQESNEKSIKRMFKKLADADDASSDSIDLKLLFSDESNDSDKNIDAKKIQDSTERFIPLKRIEAETDIPGRKDTNTDVIDGFLNTSTKKKNKKRKSNINSETNIADNMNGEELPFFIDTKGDLDPEPSISVSVTTSSNKKQKNNSMVRYEGNDAENVSDINDAPAEVSYVSEKNQKRNKTVSESTENNPSLATLEIIKPKSRGSKKKKKDQLPESQDAEQVLHLQESSGKKQKRIEVQEQELHGEPLDISVNKTPHSKKKSKRISESKESTFEISAHKTPSKKESLDSELQPSKKKSKKETMDKQEFSLPEILNVKTSASKNNKKIKALESVTNIAGDIVTEDSSNEKTVQLEHKVRENKRKRKSSANNTIEEETLGADETLVGNTKKKLKMVKSIENIDQMISKEEKHISKKINKIRNISTVEQEPQVETKKKRKERDNDDEAGKKAKVYKENSFDNIHVQRLPSNVIEQLEVRPRKEALDRKKAELVSTVDFTVEEKDTKRSLPSNFLEESVYLNDLSKAVKKKANLSKPKVLPFLPTVSTSDHGFTTNFQVHVVNQTMVFVGEKNDVPNFKNDYLSNKRAKKLKTYDLSKKHRSVKLSKF